MSVSLSWSLLRPLHATAEHPSLFPEDVTTSACSASDLLLRVKICQPRAMDGTRVALKTSPKAGSRRPQCKPYPTPRRGKRFPLYFRGRGAQSFPSPRRWMPWIRSEMRNNTWTCLSGKPDPLAHSTTCIKEMTKSNRLPFTTPTPNSR